MATRKLEAQSLVCVIIQPFFLSVFLIFVEPNASEVNLKDVVTSKRFKHTLILMYIYM